MNTVDELFCRDCGNFLRTTSHLIHCSTCERIRYKIGRYTLDEPPVFTSRALAFAAVRIEAEDLWLNTDEGDLNLEKYFVDSQEFFPRHLSNIKSKYILYEYLDALTDLLIMEPKSNTIDWSTSMKKARIASLSFVKKRFYGEERTLEDYQFDPMIQGHYRKYFLRADKRIRSGIESMYEYMDNLHFCDKCENIGERMILLSGQINPIDGCSDCI